MPKKKTTEQNPDEQIKRFQETARKLDIQMSEKEFADKVCRVVGASSASKKKRTK